MIMIIAIIYILLSYEIFDQQLKTTIRNSSVPPPPPTHLKKSPSPFFLTPSIKICASRPLFANIKNFSGLSCRKWSPFWGWRTLCFIPASQRKVLTWINLKVTQLVQIRILIQNNLFFFVVAVIPEQVYILMVYLTAIWLAHGQLWATPQGTTSPT